MRSARVFLAAGMATFCGAGMAFATHVSQVDPATVPTGFLAAHNQVQDIRIADVARAVKGGRADVFIQHVRLGANEATAWHMHPGPVFVDVVSGSVTYEDGSHGKCMRVTYEAGEGFFDRGFGHVHRAVAGASGAEFYPVYVLPPGSATHVIPAAAPVECAAQGPSDDDSDGSDQSGGDDASEPTDE